MDQGARAGKAQRLTCPICGSQIPTKRLNPPPGLPSCDRCRVRLRPSQEYPGRLEIVAQVLEQKETSAEESNRRFEQSLRKWALLGSLLSDPRSTLRSKKHRDTIHGMDGWARILEGTRGDQRIAEVLCAAKLWAENTVRARESGFLFSARDLRAFHKRDLEYHGKFKRRSRTFLQTLRQFREFLGECETYSQGYKTCLESCERLIIAMEDRQIEETSLDKTRLQDPSKVWPHSWAGAVIFAILQRKGHKKELALATCVELLALVFPKFQTANTEPLKQAIWQANLRFRARVRGR